MGGALNGHAAACARREKGRRPLSVAIVAQATVNILRVTGCPASAITGIPKRMFESPGKVDGTRFTRTAKNA